MNKTKDPNRLPAKAYIGTTFMGTSNSVIAALMQSYFLLFLTDYAGLGSWGASIGTGILTFARFFDAINDPFEGYIMDRAKPSKMGKYKPFILLSIVMTCVGVGALFMIPSFVASSRLLTSVWIIFFYLVYDVGLTFFAPNLIYRGMTLDNGERSKLLIGPRLINMVMGMACSAIVSIVAVINGSLNNLRLAFGLTVMAFVVVTGIISLVSTIPVKEKYIPDEEDSEPIKIADIIYLFKENKPFRIKFCANLFSGFIWTLMFAATVYYAKWAYCLDPVTGEVDQGLFGTLNLLISMMMFSPLILGTIITLPIMKRFKTPVHYSRFLNLAQAIPLGLIFVLHIIGVLQTSWVILIALMAVAALGMGMTFAPTEIINMECMDYDVWKFGKQRSGLHFATGQLLNKAQSAFATAAVGIVLSAVGYIVDSVTGNYLGDLANIPSMLTWFTVISGLAPCVFGVIGWFILGKYPITNETREEMHTALNK